MRKSRLAVASLALVLGMPITAAYSKDIAGQWSGTGYAQLTTGQKEQVRCKVTYDRQAKKVFGVKAVCASPSLRVHQTGTILKVTDNTYVGNLQNAEFDISARVRIVITGAKQAVTVTASEGSSRLNLRRR